MTPEGRDTRARAAELAAGYTGGYAWANRFGVCAGVVLAIVWGGQLMTVAPDGAWLSILAVTLLGILAADLLTGFIHWGCDTWGTPELPLVGRTLIRTFREHHVDPQSITRHDWAEINGEACLGATVVLTGLLMAFPISATTFLLGWWLTCFIVAAMFTNQLHKWAHMPDPPRFARWLQRCHLILTPKDHRHHHTRPFVSEDGREKSFRVISRQGKRISVTDTRRPDLYQNLSFPGSVYVDCFDTERLTGLVSNCGTTGYHDALLISDSAKYLTQL